MISAVFHWLYQVTRPVHFEETGRNLMERAARSCYIGHGYREGGKLRSFFATSLILNLGQRPTGKSVIVSHVRAESLAVMVSTGKVKCYPHEK